MTDFLMGEYIYDGYTLIGADGDISDMGHEAHIMQAICGTYAEELVDVAEGLIETSEISEDLLRELEVNKMKVERNIRQEDYDPDNIYSLYDSIKDIKYQLVSNPKLTEAMQALHGDSRKYGCKYLGYIIIRQNNFEVWEFNQETAKKVVNAAYDIAQDMDVLDVLDENELKEQELEVYSYKTNQSRSYTLGELEEGQILKTATAPKTKASMYIPQDSAPQELSPTQRHQLRYTSENFSFKNWFLESSVLNPFQAVRPKWVKPDLYEEREEMVRQAEDLNLDVKTVQIAFIRAKLITLDDATWNKMKNTNSNDPNISMEKIKTWKKDGKAVDDIIRGLEEGETIPAPMVLIHDGVPYCVAGNTRLSISKVLGVRPKVLLATTF